MPVVAVNITAIASSVRPRRVRPDTFRSLMPAQGQTRVIMRFVVNSIRALFRAEEDAPMTMGMLGETA